MIESSGSVPPGGGSPKPPQGPPPTGPTDQSTAPAGKKHRFFSTNMMFNDKQWRQFNMLLYQQFKSMMAPLWAKARKDLKRMGKNDPYASD